MKRLAAEDRFWSHVEKTDTCWLWTGSHFRSGHGCFRLNGKTVLAHRFSYELAYGACIEGLILRHVVCCNPACVRPDHLVPGTHKDNAQDRIRDGHQPHTISRSVLTEAQVKEVRELLARGQRRVDIGRCFGVTGQCISKIATGKTWKSVALTKQKQAGSPLPGRTGPRHHHEGAIR